MDSKTKDCPICKKCVSKKNLKRHLSTHEPNRKIYDCMHCEKKYLRRDRYKTHLKECTRKPEAGPRTIQEYKYLCSLCGKQYKYKKNFERHQNVCQKRKFNCTKCGMEFDSNHRLRRHGCKLKLFTYKCSQCLKGFFTKTSLERHARIFCSGIKSMYTHPRKCTTCKTEFNNTAFLNFHRFKCKINYKKMLQKKLKEPKKRQKKRKQFGYGENDPALKQLYKNNRHIIKRGHRKGKLSQEYNYEINNDITYFNIDNHLNEIYNQQTKSFKINMSFGYVLRNIETAELRFYYPQQNDTVLSSPASISNRLDLKRTKEKIRGLDILQKIFVQRPNTKWTLYQLSVIRYNVYHIVQYTLGNGDLPEYIKVKKCIVGFVKNCRGETYNDNLCIFRCLAVHNGNSIKRADIIAKRLYSKYIKNIPHSRNKHSFQGIRLDEIHKFEKIFEINVDIYEMFENGCVQIVKRSLGKYENTMYLNIYRNHLSLIKNMNQYTMKYTCQHCRKHFKKANKLKIHERMCQERIKLVFPGKYFTMKPSIFERLSDFGINVEKSNQFYTSFAVYDFEACLMKVQEQDCTNKLQWLQEHKPISVSICSNIGPFTKPECFVEVDEDILLEKMVSYLTKIQKHNSKTIYIKFRKIFERLEEIKYQVNESDDNNSENDSDDDDDGNVQTEDIYDILCDQSSQDGGEEEEATADFTAAMSRPNSFRQFLSK